MRDQTPLRVLLFSASFAAALHAQGATRLEGLVLDPLSQPVANARITVEIEGEVVAHTQSDAQGTFVVGRVPAQVVVVRATTRTPDVGATSVDLFAEPRGFARLHVMPARTVAGTARDDAGAPVAGAWIACVPTGAAEFGCVGSHTVSDAEGRFTLTHVPFGRIALRAWAAGRAGFATAVDGTADATVACTLSRDDVQERAFELVDSTPEQRVQARLEISVWADGAELLLPPSLRRPALADDSTWPVTGWPHDDAMHAHMVLPTAFVDPILLRIEPGSTSRQKRFYVEDAGDSFVRGKLVGEGGLPTTGIELLAQGLWAGNAGSRTTVVTLADGTFALPSPVARGDMFLLRCIDPALALRAADAPGRRLLEHPPRLGAVGKHTKAHVQQFTLLRARSVRCRLLDAEGLPLPGDVALLGTGRQEVTRSAPNGVIIHHQDAPVLAHGRSGRDGTFELAGLDLREGETVCFQVAGPRGFLEHEFVVTEALVQDLGELRTGPAATLHGQVETLDSKPFAGARLKVENWCGGERTHFVASDRQGTFMLLGLMPGPCRVSVIGQRNSGQAAQLVKDATTDITVQ